MLACVSADKGGVVEIGCPPICRALRHPRAPILKPTEREHVPDALQRREETHCIFGQISRCLSSSISRKCRYYLHIIPPVRCRESVTTRNAPWLSVCLPAADISGLQQAGNGRSGQPVSGSYLSHHQMIWSRLSRSDARGQLCSIRATAFPIHNSSVPDPPFRAPEVPP